MGMVTSMLPRDIKAARGLNQCARAFAQGPCLSAQRVSAVGWMNSRPRFRYFQPYLVRGKESTTSDSHRTADQTSHHKSKLSQPFVSEVGPHGSRNPQVEAGHSVGMPPCDFERCTDNEEDIYFILFLLVLARRCGAGQKLGAAEDVALKKRLAGGRP